MKFLSICVLSYNRLSFLGQSLQTIKDNTKNPYELIVIDDGSDKAVREYIFKLLCDEKISTAIFNGGKNMGVGESIRRGFEVAQGDYLIKSDQDLLYEKDWDDEMVKICDIGDVGMVGGFKYHVDHPTAGWKQSNPELVKSKDLEFYVVDDFVSSMFMITKDIYKKYGPFPVYSDGFGEDVQFKEKLTKDKLKLCLTKDDKVVNQGFGLGKSTLFTEDSTEDNVKVIKITTEPLIFNKDK